MEKKENAMAARAASAPSFSGLYSDFDTRHWSARKQKLTNHKNAHKPGKGPATKLKKEEQKYTSILFPPNVHASFIL